MIQVRKEGKEKGMTKKFGNQFFSILRFENILLQINIVNRVYSRLL